MTEVESDAYYFPPGRSVARRVHGERSVGLLYGQRALLIGALEPLTYTGTMLSTRSGDRPFERLARTAKIQETIFLGTRAEADEALAKVRRVHETIKGELPTAAGRHPAGSAYSAFDPQLMLWTLAVIADSGRAMYETLVRPLSTREREDLWQDYVRFGELFGLPGSELPASYREFEAWWRERLDSPDLRRPSTRSRWRRCAPSDQPVPTVARGNLALQNHIIKGTLATTRAQDLRHPLEPRPPVELPGAAAAHRRSRRFFPRQVRRGRNDVFFDVVSKTERQRGGTATPQLRVGAP